MGGFVESFIEPSEVKSEAAFTVRASRDLSKLFEEDGVSPADCNTYSEL